MEAHQALGQRQRLEVGAEGLPAAQKALSIRDPERETSERVQALAVMSALQRVLQVNEKLMVIGGDTTCARNVVGDGS